MASRYARSLALIALVLLMASEPVFAQTNVDYDTDDNYIEVASHAQLNAVRHDPNGNGDATQADYLAAFPNRITTSTKRMGCLSGTCTGYERIADLDFDSDGDGDVDASDHGGSYWNSGAGWDPIGTNSARYATHFKGNGPTINNLFINRNFAGDNGLFGSIHTTSRIESLGITNASVTGSNFTGILVGTNYGTVVACYTTGTVQGMDTTVQYNLQPPGIPTSVTVTPKADTLDVRWRASSYATGYKV